MRLAELVEAYHARAGTAEIPLAFEFPDLDAGLPPGVDRVRKGEMTGLSAAKALQALLEKRGVALTLCRLMGTGSDTVKAMALLDGKAELTAAASERYLAQELDAISALYGPKSLKQAARAERMLRQAEAARRTGERERCGWAEGGSEGGPRETWSIQPKEIGDKADLNKWDVPLLLD